MNLEIIHTELRSEKFDWFVLSPIEPFNLGNQSALWPRAITNDGEHFHVRSISIFWHARQHSSKQAGLLVELPNSGARRLLVTACRNSKLLESCGTISTEHFPQRERERHFLNCGPLSHFQIFHDFSEGLFGLHMGAGFSVCPIFASLVFANQESPLTTGKK